MVFTVGAYHHGMSIAPESASIGSFTAVCAASGRTLAAGERCVSALMEDAAGVLRRVDLAADAWESWPQRDGAICYWRMLAPTPEQRRTFVDNDTLLEILERLAQSEEPRRIAYRWLIALILLRKRVLKQDGIERDGEAEFWKFRLRGADDGHPGVRVRNPGLKDEDLRELSDQLAEVVRSEG